MEKETLEEAAEKYTEKLYYKVNSIDEFNGEPLGVHNAFIEGAKWQQERMYSEEEVLKLVDGAFHMYASSHRYDAKEWLVEQLKKK
jgi:hypothetical protein